MGMYTGLRVKVTVKEEYRKMLRAINGGEEWLQFSCEYPFLAGYAALGRSEFIPNGMISYMPDSWETDDYRATEGFETGIDMRTGRWTFQCSLKNYENEIEKFLDEVLPNIITSSEHIEYFYEEWDSGRLYEFVDGKLVVIQYETCRY